MLKKIPLDLKKIFDLKPKAANLIAIDIGSSSVKIACVRMVPASALLFYSIIDIRADNSDKAIADAVRKTLEDNESSVKDAVLLITDESVTIRRMELPAMARDEIPGALKWQVKEIVHFDVEKAVIDFRVLNEHQKEDGSRSIELLVVIVSRDAIDSKVQILKKASLNAVAVSVTPFGIEGVTALCHDASRRGTVLAIDFGYQKTEILILKDGKLEFVRMVPIGSKDITDALTAAIMTDNGQVELSSSDAEDIKSRLGIPYESSTLDNGVTSIQILTLMRPVLERLSKEVKRSLDYYSQEYGGEETSAVYLVGGGARLKNLARFLGEELNAPVKYLELSKAINTAKARLTEDDALAVTAVIGSALGYGKGPNLLPHELRVEKIEFIEKVSLRMTGTIAAVILMVSFFFINFRLGDYRERLKNAVLQKGALTQIMELQEKVTRRAVFLTQVQGSDLPIEYVMKELGCLTPENIALDEFRIDPKSKAMDLKGAVYGPRVSAEEVLTKFMEALEKTRYVKDAQLTSIQDKTAGGDDRTGFDINCVLK